MKIRLSWRTHAKSNQTQSTSGLKKVLFSVIGISMLGLSQAQPVIINTALPDIGTDFDALITATGATVIEVAVVPGQSTYTYLDANGNPATLTVTRIDGQPLVTQVVPPLTEPAWIINPSADPAQDTIPGQNSGLRFEFSAPVNAFGMEIEDWATCCMNVVRPPAIVSTYGVPAEGSGLWIAFDGGAATLPANALVRSDNPGDAYSSGSAIGNFIGAIDNSGTFSSIEFWGDGFGEFLFAGGTLRFAAVPIVPQTGDPRVQSIPSLSTWAMLMSLFAVATWAGLAIRRKRG